jgi:ABC-type antimicrobial peptide transport system permease subunit
LHSINTEQRVITAANDLEEGLQHQPVWAQQRLFSILFSSFAVLALVLSLVGLGSTLTFAIAQRRSELGIRMALGARRAHIVWSVARSSLATVAGGISVGLVLNLFVGTMLRHWTPASVSAPWMIAGVTLLLLLCASITCLIPARRAANLDPAETLRCD